jgi:hypothetical protein
MHSNTDGRLAADRFNLESTWDSGLKFGLLRVQNNGFYCFQQSFEPGNNCYQLRVNLVIIITSLDDEQKEDSPSISFLAVLASVPFPAYLAA